MKYKESQKEIIFFLAGFMLGVYYIYFMGDEKGGVTDFFSLQNLMQIRYIEVVQEEYFLYLVKKRCGILLLLGILSLAIAGKYLLQGFLMLLGCSMGSMLSVLIVRYGLRGMLLFFGFVFPQDLLYIPALFGGVMLLTDWNERVFGKTNIYWKKGTERQSMWKRMLFWGGVTIIGLLLECYVNLFFVKCVLKIF